MTIGASWGPEVPYHRSASGRSGESIDRHHGRRRLDGAGRVEIRHSRVIKHCVRFDTQSCTVRRLRGDKSRAASAARVEYKIARQSRTLDKMAKEINRLFSPVGSFISGLPG